MRISKTKFLMGTDITINIYDRDVSKNLLNKAFSIFEKNEKVFSRFDKNSTLSKLNKEKVLDVEDEFIKVLQLSKFFYKKTNGYFNPLVNLKNIGYTESFDKKNFYKQKSKVNLDFDSVKVEGNKVILQEYQNLDFGGIVKGWTVDLVANFLIKSGIKYFLIDAGGDIYGTSKNQESFNIQIDDTNKIINLKNKAICTSGIYKRNWTLDKTYHHILNPNTGGNNFDIKSISIITDYAVIGDVYATACIAMGKERAENFLKKEKICYIIR